MARSVIDSTIGPVFISASEKGLRGLLFGGSAIRAAVESNGEEEPAGEAGAIIRAAEEQLSAYFGGMLRSFDLPLDVQGTDFQRKVWEAIAAIPYGEVMSYGETAAAAGYPGASR